MCDIIDTRNDSRNIAHARDQHCCTNPAKRLQHHATSTNSNSIFKFEPTTPNMSQHVATGWPNVRNMLLPAILSVVICCVEMLWSFGWGLRKPWAYLGLTLGLPWAYLGGLGKQNQWESKNHAMKHNRFLINFLLLSFFLVFFNWVLSSRFWHLIKLLCIINPWTCLSAHHFITESWYNGAPLAALALIAFTFSIVASLMYWLPKAELPASSSYQTSFHRRLERHLQTS